MMRLAVMASGGGSNFKAILDRINSGDLKACVVLLVSNNSKAGAMQKARDAGIEALHLPPSRFADEETYLKVLLAHLDRVEAEMVVLAGYMKKLPAGLVSTYHHKILNIHPALLPSFGGKGMYGHFVHEAVIEQGARVSGVTVHLVDPEYDKGPIIAQKAVEVKNDDTPKSLAARVLIVEHDTYWRALKLFSENRIRIDNKRAIIS